MTQLIYVTLDPDILFRFGFDRSPRFANSLESFDVVLRIELMILIKQTKFLERASGNAV